MYASGFGWSTRGNLCFGGHPARRFASGASRDCCVLHAAVACARARAGDPDNVGISYAVWQPISRCSPTWALNPPPCD